MNVAIIGLPGAGKKTLFTLLTGRTIPAGRKESEALEGRAVVKDPRVDELAKICKPNKTVYADNMFVLCPDVTQDSSNRSWLEEARKCDMLCMVVRAFKDESIYHPAGSVNPERDRQALETELLFADLTLIETRLERIEKEKRRLPSANRLQVQLEEDALCLLKQMIEAEKWLGSTNLDKDMQAAVKSLNLLTLKSIVWVFNVDEKGVDETSVSPLTVSCKIEQEITQIEDEEDRKVFLRDLNMTSSSVDRMNRVVYDTLGLMSFYTMGPDEVRAWTIKKNTLAPKAGGKVHSDIERGFIRVSVIKFEDLVALGSEKAVKSAGKEYLKGKDYIISDGDICEFRFNV